MYEPQDQAVFAYKVQANTSRSLNKMPISPSSIAISENVALPMRCATASSLVLPMHHNMYFCTATKTKPFKIHVHGICLEMKDKDTCQKHVKGVVML